MKKYCREWSKEQVYQIWWSLDDFLDIEKSGGLEWDRHTDGGETNGQADIFYCFVRLISLKNLSLKKVQNRA